ncbi:MAG: thioredoxin family protein [Candidatus Pacebacteria bacterium]|nr:thioredoxin family protein [Candidatus Paceibacterota bacterium]
MKVLKIGAIWCAECLTMKPMWEEIAKEVPELQSEYFDADENEELLKKYDVKEIPVFIFLDKEGEEMFRLKGLQNKEELIKAVKENLNK